MYDKWTISRFRKKRCIVSLMTANAHTHLYTHTLSLQLSRTHTYTHTHSYTKLTRCHGTPTIESRLTCESVGGRGGGGVDKDGGWGGKEIENLHICLETVQEKLFYRLSMSVFDSIHKHLLLLNCQVCIHIV